MSGRLLCRSCTTGWLDWVHGELWLTPTALVRRRLSLAETRTHDLGPSVEGTAPRDDSPEATGWRPQHRTDLVVPLTAVRSADLRRGRLSDRLGLRLQDGTRLTLLWLSAEPASAVLEQELPRLLGPRYGA